jgi:hypothetical protein
MFQEIFCKVIGSPSPMYVLDTDLVLFGLRSNKNACRTLSFDVVLPFHWQCLRHTRCLFGLVFGTVDGPF